MVRLELHASASQVQMLRVTVSVCYCERNFCSVVKGPVRQTAPKILSVNGAALRSRQHPHARQRRNSGLWNHKVHVVRYFAGTFGGKFYGLYSEVSGLRNFMFRACKRRCVKWPVWWFMSFTLWRFSKHNAVFTQKRKSLTFVYIALFFLCPALSSALHYASLAVVLRWWTVYCYDWGQSRH